MNFGKRTPEPEARRIIDRALDAGITVLDTANSYNDGESERVVGRAVAGRRDRFTIATKVGYGRAGGKPEGLSPEAIRRAIDGSLQRLGVDQVDIYYLHVPDPTVPIEETLHAMADLVRRGKIKTFGVSNFASWQVLELIYLADARGWPRPAIAQQIYNLLVRQLEIEYLRFAKAYGVPTTVYNPLAGGVLTDRSLSLDEVPAGSRFDGNKLYQRRYWTRRMHDEAAAYREVARASGRSLVELSYAWLARRPGVDSILVGPGTVGHLEDALRAVARPLSDDEVARVDEVARDTTGTDAVYARTSA
jgi:aryl-alcohol dehydrogenase-like predicted oxidoreductase